MKSKTINSVHFLTEITTEIELELINQTSTNIQKVNGKTFLLKKNDLTKHNKIEYFDVLYEKNNQTSFYLCMMILSAHPFRNFIDNWSKKLNNKISFVLLNNIWNLYQRLKKGKLENVERFIMFEGCTNIEEGYSFLLRNLHNELIKHFFFEEDIWSNQKKGKDYRNVYKEYSPIVDIFQGKLLERVGQTPPGYFEIVSAYQVNDLFDQKNCVKLPYVILVQTDRVISIDKFTVSSILCYDGFEYSIVVCNKEMVKYSGCGYERVSGEDLCGVVYVMYSRI